MKKRVVWPALGLLLLACGTSSPRVRQEQAGYSYVSVLYGTGTVRQVISPDLAPILENMPILTGDTVAMHSGSARVTLSDDSHIFVGAGTTVTFEKIAGSPDANDATTVLYVRSSR